jgi:regulator of sirC expression with transglutaminase-like and TPR domain
MQARECSETGGYTPAVPTGARPTPGERFAALLELDPVPLDEAALAIAADEYADLDPAAYLARLDALGERVSRRVPGPRRAASALRALQEVLAREEGLRGNEQDYYDPRNSFVNEVLDRRLGIPISLSVVYVEVARRAGLDLHGVGLPGHFLARYVSATGTEVYVDAYNGGELLSADECAARFRARFRGRELERRWLAPLTTRQILSRMLGNLRRIYAERRDDVRLFSTLDRILAVAPGQLAAVRDRGLAASRLGGAGAARRDLETYLAAAGDAPDADAVRRVLEGLRRDRPLVN